MLRSGPAAYRSAVAPWSTGPQTGRMDLQICGACGAWLDDPVVAPAVAAVACGTCGYSNRFLRLPLFAVTGPSGVGKSTVCALLAERLRGRAVVLDHDLLWVAGLAEPDPVEGHRLFRTTWLRLAAAIGNGSGRPVVLCGTVVPEQFESCPQRRFFSEIRYLVLVCDDGELAKRLRARPAWRGWDEERIAEAAAFNRWLKQNAPDTRPPMRLLDTTGADLDQTVALVGDWVLEGLGGTDWCASPASTSDAAERAGPSRVL